MESDNSKVALVTGASSGIGAATAVALAAAGFRVAASARRADRLEQLVARIAAAGGEAVAVPADLADAEAAGRVVEQTVERLGRIDVLVNAAGVIQAGGVENADIAEWRRVIDINLISMLAACRAAIPAMKRQGGGDIVNVSSIAGRRASGVFAPYATSKFGVNALTEGLRQEVGGGGIRVCVVEPGATSTEVADGMTDPRFRDSIREHVTKDGAMEPEDVAASIAFVVSLPARANVSEILIRPTIDTVPL